jgi:hypothetical protein
MMTALESLRSLVVLSVLGLALPGQAPVVGVAGFGRGLARLTSVGVMGRDRGGLTHRNHWPLQLAGYHVSHWPMTTFCASLSILWPLQPSNSSHVPNL